MGLGRAGEVYTALRVSTGPFFFRDQDGLGRGYVRRGGDRKNPFQHKIMHAESAEGLKKQQQ